MRTQASLTVEFQERNRRLRRILVTVAALLGLLTILYIALHRQA
jgi:hypothetical protein